MIEETEIWEGKIVGSEPVGWGNYKYFLLTKNDGEIFFYTDRPANFSSGHLYRVAVGGNSQLLGAEPILKLSWWKRLFSSSPSPNRSDVFLKAYSIKIENKKFSDGNVLVVNVFFVFLVLLAAIFSLGLVNCYLDRIASQKNPNSVKNKKTKLKAPKIS